MFPGSRLRRGRRAVAAASFALAEGRLSDAEHAFISALAQVRDAVDKDGRATAIAIRAEAGTGRVRLKRGDYQGAAKSFAEVLRLGGNSRGHFFWAGCAAAHCHEYSQAEALFTSAIDTQAEQAGQTDRADQDDSPGAVADDQPSLDRVYRHRAYTRLRLGDYDRSLADLSMVESLLGMDDEARLVAAWISAQKRRWAQARRYLQDVTVPGRQHIVDALTGYVAYHEGRRYRAISAFAQARAVAGEDIDLRLAHGFVAYDIGDFDAGIEIWEPARARGPRDPRLQRLVKAARLGRVHQLALKGEYEAAAAQLRIVDRDHPASFPLRLNALFAASSRGGGSRELMVHLLDGDLPDSPEVWRCLAALFAVEGRHAAAQTFWARVLARDPADRLARLGSLLAAVDGGRPDQALAVDLSAVAWKGAEDLRQHAVHAIAGLHIRRGDWDAALAVLSAEGQRYEEWEEVTAEGLYRTGRFEELLDLPDSEALLPWKALAWLSLGAPDRIATATARTYVVAAMTHERTRGQVARLAYPPLLAHVAAEEWQRASALLACIGGTSAGTTASGSGPGAEPAEAVVHVLGGDRTTAISVIAEASRRRPLDGRIGLVRALILLHTLSAADPTTDTTADNTTTDAAADWRSCIAAWAQLLHHEEFWTSWTEQSERRYRAPVTPQMVQTLRASLRSLLESRIALHDGPGKMLAAQWSREDSAAARFAEHGGLPLPRPSGGPGDLVCGPLRIGELRLHAAFAAYLRLPPSIEDELRYQFSQVGLADARLTEGYPAEVEALAMDLRCPECRTAEEPASRDGSGDPLLCRPKCPSFARYNPAFSSHELTAARRLLSHRAHELSVQALMAVSRTLIVADPVDGTELADCWRRAIGHADRCGRKASVSHDVSTLALGRATVLASAARWTEEIAVLDSALAAIGEEPKDDRDELEKALGRSLENRSCEVYNSTYQESRPSLAKVEQAVADQRRSVSLRPHIRRSTENLGLMLRFAQGMHSKRGERGLLRALLVEEEELYARALAFHGEEPDFETRLNDVRARIVKEFGG